jgi:gluconokinase
MSDRPLVWIISGVSGSGKSVIGRLLSARLESDFVEGDLRHPLANLTKMLAGQPLQDEDRQQWLLALKDDIRRAMDRNIETVITCSALKASYRRDLAFMGRVQLVWLDVPPRELARRLARRPDHYMQPEMLAGQMEALEPISPGDDVIIVDGSLQPSEIIIELLSRAVQRFPGLKEPWWQRRLD